MKRLIEFWQKLTGVWKFSGVMAKLAYYSTTYPGVEHSAKLRAWIRPALLDLSVLTALSETTLDDRLTWAALHIVDSDKSWAAVFALLTIASERDGYLIPGSPTMKNAILDAQVFTETLLDENNAENPALIIAAIGLIVQLIQLLQARRKK